MNYYTLSRKVLFIEQINTKSEIAMKKSFIGRFAVALLLAVVSLTQAFTVSEVFGANEVSPATIRAFDSENGGLLGSELLQFLGNMSEDQAAKLEIPEGSVVLRIDPKVTTGKSLPYYLLVRNVEPLEADLLDDARDGTWDSFELFTAALIAEGNTETEALRNYKLQMDRIVSRINAEAKADSKLFSKEDLTKKIFTSLHGDVLKGRYDINCTDLGQVLETGNYNCVSATVMFNVIAQRLGLDVCGLEMPGHALSRVKLANGEYIDLETTCANWFSLKDATARRSATMEKVARPAPLGTGYANAQPLGNARTSDDSGIRNQVEANQVAELSDITKKLREVSPVQLVAAIYYNQGVDRINEGRYAEALILNAKANQLDPENETVWKHILAPINNWAIEYAKQKRYNVAAKLLDEGRKIDPEYENFKLNQLHVYFHWMQALGEAKRYQDAEIVFAQANARLPENPYLNNLIRAIRSEAAAN